MDIGDWIKAGDRVQIIINGISYNTIVEGVSGGGDFCLSPPLSRLKMILPDPDQICALSKTRNRGLLVFDIRVVGIERNDNIPLIRATAVSEPHKVQRRKSFRTDIILDATVRRSEKAPEEQKKKPDEPSYDIKTLNISEDGMLFISDRPYSAGDALVCDISLNRFDMNERLEKVGARVIRCEATEEGRYKVAVQFTGCSKKDENLLLRFIAFSQRRKKG